MTSGKDLLSVVLRVRIAGDRSRPADVGRASVDSQSVVLKSRYDVRGTSSGHPPHHGGGAGGGGGTPGTSSPVRPLGRVRLVRNQDPDDMSFTLPSLRRSRDHAPEVVDDRGLEAGRQQVQRRRQGPGQGQGQRQTHTSPVVQTPRLVGSGGGQQLTGGTPHRSAIGANPAKPAKANSGDGHYGQPSPAATAHGGEVDGQGPKTKMTTTTMFINRNECMYIERSVPTSETPLTAQSYHPGDLLQGRTADPLLWQEGGAVTSTGSSGAVYSGHLFTGAPGQQFRSSASSSCTNSSTSRTTADSSSSLQLPRVSAYLTTQTATSGRSSVQSPATPTFRAAVGPRENNDFAKKLRLVTHRTKSVQDRKATDSHVSESTNTGGSHGGQHVDTPVRRSINLPMRIKVHLPSTPSASGVTRERLLVEKARRDIREILRDGASGPESNHSAYSVAAEPFSDAPQAKLTPVLFPPNIPDPLASAYFAGQYTAPGQYTAQTQTATATTAAVTVYSGGEFGTCRREVTWAAGTEPETTMLTQYYPPSSPAPALTGSPSSPALISTHRVPLAARAQSARPGGRAVSSRAAPGGGHNNSRPASPGGYASSRPTSALSTRGMPRSCSSSISDNLTMASTPETEVDSRLDGRRALWPSLIDVQRLKIGGFRYKNKPSQPRYGSDVTAASPLQQDPARHQQHQEDEPPQEQTLEARTKTIVNLGTIIVPSHTCVDCPLCNLYYAKEDLWPDGGGQQHTHSEAKNTNNNNNSNNKISMQARRAKSARPCRSTDHLGNDQWDEVDISRAAAQLNREYSVTTAPRTSPEPEVLTPPPESVDEEEPEVESVAPESTVSEPEVKGTKPPEVVQGLLQEERPGSAQPKKALLGRRRPCTSNVIRSSVRNPYKDFRNDGVSVTVRLPASPGRSDSRQKADYEQLIKSLNKGPVTFKFSYVKVSPSDLFTQHAGRNKPS